MRSRIDRVTIWLVFQIGFCGNGALWRVSQRRLSEATYPALAVLFSLAALIVNSTMKRKQKAQREANASLWEVGWINGIRARRNRITGECWFVLWKAGEQGHAADCWHRFGLGHEKHFRN